MIKNLAGQTAGAQMISASTGAAFTSTVTAYITGDAGTQAIGSVGAGVCVHEGNGYHTYRPSQAETNYNLVAFTFIGSGAIPVSVQFATLTAAESGSLSNTTAPGASTVRALIEDAMAEIGVIAAGEQPSAADATFCLGKLNRILDNWNADRALVFGDTFEQFTITPSLQPHTIGPNSATWTTTTRPVSIEGIALIVGGFYYYLNKRDADWWQWQMNPTLTGTEPTDFYYNPGWGNGEVYLWPVPSTAYDVQVWTRGLLSLVSLGDSLSLPPGYADAIVLTLAEEIASAFSRPVPEQTALSARRARARIMENNTAVPTITTRPYGSLRQGWYDYYTGRLRP